MILIYGKARVGMAVKSLAQYLGIQYQICDDQDSIPDYTQYENIIPTPGISPAHPIYKQEVSPILGELDFASQYLPKDTKIIAVTGTDGKSTNCWIIYNLLAQYFGQDRVYLSGNFDVPLSETVQQILEKKQENPIIVLEVSSFMAYNIRSFQSDYTIFTNFQSDHLNWHESLEDYFQSKWRLVTHTKSGIFIHEQVAAFAREFSVSLENLPHLEIFGTSDKYTSRVRMPIICIDNTEYLHLHVTKFTGLHNALNLLTSILVVRKLGIPDEIIREILPTIDGLAHRIETIGIIRGVHCIDDSKSTSNQSLQAALGSFDEYNRHIVLIAGGSDKGDTFDNLENILRHSVKQVVLIGQTSQVLAKKCQIADIPFIFAQSMQDAVEKGFQFASEGEILLLSPGCASFDMFHDYLDRAQQFRNACNSYVLL